MVKIKQNTSVVDVALNLSGSITGLPAVVDQLPVGNRVGFLSGWAPSVGTSKLTIKGSPAVSEYGLDTKNCIAMTSDSSVLLSGEFGMEILFTARSADSLHMIFVTYSETPNISNSIMIALLGPSLSVIFPGTEGVALAEELELNKLHQVVVTNGAAWLDGVKTEFPVNSIEAADEYHFGGTLFNGNPNVTFDGVISSIRIFDHKLSDSDVETLRNGGDPLSYQLPVAWIKQDVEFPTSDYTSGVKTFDKNGTTGVSFSENNAGSTQIPEIHFMAINATIGSKNIANFAFHNRPEMVDRHMRVELRYSSSADFYDTDGSNVILPSTGGANNSAVASFIAGPGDFYIYKPDATLLQSVYFAVLSITGVGCIAQFSYETLEEPMPAVWQDVGDIGQTWTPDLQGMELDLDVPVYDTLGKEKAPYSTDLFALQRAITDGEGYLRTLSNLIE